MTSSIAIASDHAGYALKSVLADYMRSLGHDVLDLGTDNEASVDYPDFGHELAKVVFEGKTRKGIAICGSGIGISIAVNRHNNIRCALCYNVEAATLARQHNDANVLALGARMMDESTAKQCIDAFLNTEFEGGRHQVRVEKLG